MNFVCLLLALHVGNLSLTNDTIQHVGNLSTFRYSKTNNTVLLGGNNDTKHRDMNNLKKVQENFTVTAIAFTCVGLVLVIGLVVLTARAYTINSARRHNSPSFSADRGTQHFMQMDY